MKHFIYAWVASPKKRYTFQKKLLVPEGRGDDSALTIFTCNTEQGDSVNLIPLYKAKSEKDQQAN